MTTEYTEDWQEVRILGNYAWQWGKMSETRRLASGKMETMRVMPSAFCAANRMEAGRSRGPR